MALVAPPARRDVSTQTSSSTPAPANDWDIHSHQDKELVKALGLTSATMLVMGSMIGSGIFIVSAEISREVSSPALLIGAWLVTAVMTIRNGESESFMAASQVATRDRWGSAEVTTR